MSTAGTKWSLTTTTRVGSHTLAPSVSSREATRRGPPESCIINKSMEAVTISPGRTCSCLHACAMIFSASVEAKGLLLRFPVLDIQAHLVAELVGAVLNVQQVDQLAGCIERLTLKSEQRRARLHLQVQRTDGIGRGCRQGLVDARDVDPAALEQHQAGRGGEVGLVELRVVGTGPTGVVAERRPGAATYPDRMHHHFVGVQLEHRAYVSRGNGTAELKQTHVCSLGENLQVLQQAGQRPALRLRRGVMDDGGPWRGSLLAGWRLLRCQPLCDGGEDQVPGHFHFPRCHHHDESGDAG